MSEQKKREDQRPPAAVIYKTDETNWQTRTEIALDKVQERSIIRERLRALEDFVNRVATERLGDRFMSKPEIKAFVAMLVTDFKTSWGSGIAEREPLQLRNLNSAEWFFEEYTTSRVECTKRNLTTHPITEWDFDNGHPETEAARRRESEEFITKTAKELQLSPEQVSKLRETQIAIAPPGMRVYHPGQIMRHGEDNPWTIQMGMYCLRYLHHSAIRTVLQTEGRPQTVIAKDVTAETRASWELPQQPQAPRTPAQ